MSAIEDLREEIQRLFGPDGVASNPDTPFICPTPWFNELERLLEEENAHQTDIATSEKKPPSLKRP